MTVGTTMENNAFASAYCRRCSYPLAGLPTPRCPECGRAFDPANRRSFDRSPRRRTLRRLGRWAVALVVLVAVLASPVVWVYAGWRAERAAVAAGGKSLLVYARRRIGPPWFARILGERAYWLDRVDGFSFRAPHRDPGWAGIGSFANATKAYLDTDTSNPANDDDMSGIAKLKNLSDLRLQSAICSDVTLESIAASATLKTVMLCGLPRVTASGFGFLSNAVRLERLWITGLETGDDAIAAMHLERKPNLTFLSISDSRMSNLGFRMVISAPSIEVINIDGADRLTDGALVGISDAKSLKSLYLTQCHLAGSNLDELAGLNKLEAIRISQCRIGCRNLLRLPLLPRLATVDLEVAGLDEPAVRRLGKLPSLRAAEIHATGNEEATEEAADALHKLPVPNVRIDLP